MHKRFWLHVLFTSVTSSNESSLNAAFHIITVCNDNKLESNKNNKSQCSFSRDCSNDLTAIINLHVYQTKTNNDIIILNWRLVKPECLIPLGSKLLIDNRYSDHLSKLNPTFREKGSNTNTMWHGKGGKWLCGKLW